MSNNVAIEPPETTGFLNAKAEVDFAARALGPSASLIARTDRKAERSDGTESNPAALMMIERVLRASSSHLR